MADNDPIEWGLYDTDLTTKLAILPVAQSHLYLEFQEPGSGEIRIPLDSAAAALVASGQFIVCRYRGSDRGGFFVDNIKQVDADGSEGAGRWLSISGRGPLAILDDAIVWQDGSGATVRVFTGQTKAAILKTLIDEAVARGALAELDYDFDATTSSDAATWTDSEDYDINVGISLLDVLRMFAKTGEIEFGVTLQGGAQPILLSAYKNGIGSDKSDSVYFRIGMNCEEVGRDERGDEIKNALLVKYKTGYAVVSDPTSISNRRRREQLLSLEAAQSSDSASTYASAQLDGQKDPQASITVKVFDGIAPYLFVDYILGDTVTVDRFGEENTRRILGIQANFDGDRPSDVVLEMDTIFYDSQLRTRNELDDLLNRWNTARDNSLSEVREWLPLGNPSGEIYTLHHSNGYLYVGGDFTSIGGAAISYIARYQISTGAWSAMGSSIASKVVAITDIAGIIYCATDTDIYEWSEGSGAWFEIGDLDNLATGQIESLYSDGIDLYVTGRAFTGINSVNMPSNVGRWDGSWYQVGNTVEHVCYKVLHFNGDLYGAFGLTATGNRGLMKQVAGVWTPVFASATKSVETMAVVGSRLAFVWGSPIPPASTLQIWDGVAAAPTQIGEVFSGGGTTGFLYRMASNLSDLYLGDIIQIVDTGTTDYNNIARYSGGVWTMLGAGLSTTSSRVRAICIVDGAVYVGGQFTTAGDKPAANLAVFVTTFQSLVQHLSNGSTFDLGAAIHGATAASLTDNDEFPFWEDTSQGLRKITWANIKSTLQTFFNSVYARLAAINVFTRQQQIVNATNGEGGIYAETIGDAYTLDTEQYTVGDNVTSPTHFLYRQSSGAGNITAPMIHGQQADSGAGTITGPWFKFEHEGTEEAMLEKGGSLRLKAFLDLLEGSAPSSPTTGRWRLYAKSDGIYYKDDAGVEIGPLGTGGGLTQEQAVHVSHSANQSINSGVLTTLAWNTEEWDTNAMHDTVTNNSRLTCKEAGKYLVICEVEFAANATGRRAIVLLKNGTAFATTKVMTISDAGATTSFQCVAEVSLAVNDYVEAQAFQASGGALNVLTGVNTWMSMRIVRG